MLLGCKIKHYQLFIIVCFMLIILFLLLFIYIMHDCNWISKYSLFCTLSYVYVLHCQSVTTFSLNAYLISKQPIALLHDKGLMKSIDCNCHFKRWVMCSSCSKSIRKVIIWWLFSQQTVHLDHMRQVSNSSKKVIFKLDFGFKADVDYFG